MPAAKVSPRQATQGEVPPYGSHLERVEPAVWAAVGAGVRRRVGGGHRPPEVMVCAT